MIKIPDAIKPILDEINKYGVAVIVGGFIRDAILGIKSNDIDIEVFNIKNPDILQKLVQKFGSANLVGKNFGVFKINIKGYMLDIALARVEKKISSGHKGFEVSFIDNFDYKQAAKRRDFTINSIGYDTKTDKILDPYNGIVDLKNKILNYINEHSFIEDPLRVFRAIVFCARFNLTCTDSLLQKCKFLADKHYIDELAKERIFGELQKLLLLSKNPSIGFKLFIPMHLNIYFPELLYVKNNFLYLDNMVKLKTGDKKIDIILMLCVIVFDFPSLYETNTFLDKITNDKYIKKEVQNLFLHKTSLQNITSSKITNYKIYKLSTTVNIKHLLLINKARGVEYKSIKTTALKLNVLTNKIEPIISGKDLINLGLKPSKEFSVILNKAYDAQFRELFFSKSDAMRWLKNYLSL